MRAKIERAGGDPWGLPGLLEPTLEEMEMWQWHMWQWQAWQMFMMGDDEMIDVD